MLKATGVPIDRYSYEAAELLKDIIYPWKERKALKESSAFADAGNVQLARAVDIPESDLSIMQHSPEHQRLLNDIGAAPVPIRSIPIGAAGEVPHAK